MGEVTCTMECPAATKQDVLTDKIFCSCDNLFYDYGSPCRRQLLKKTEEFVGNPTKFIFDMMNKTPYQLTDTARLHEKICAELTKTYREKNHDYGDSFHQSWAEYGITMAAIRIGDKYNRLKTLTKAEKAVQSESVRDTLMDLANYAILTVMEIDRENGQASDNTSLESKNTPT